MTENLWHAIYANLPGSRKINTLESCKEIDRITQEIITHKAEIEQLETEAEVWMIIAIKEIAEIWPAKEIVEGMKSYIKNNYEGNPND